MARYLWIHCLRHDKVGAIWAYNSSMGLACFVTSGDCLAYLVHQFAENVAIKQFHYFGDGETRNLLALALT